MNFRNLTESSQLENIIEQSKQYPKGILLFKHSTRCAISQMALGRFERGWKVEPGEMPVYYLDLIRYRDVSNAVSERLGVVHESPQILLIQNGECVYSASHNAISPQAIEEEVLDV